MASLKWYIQACPLFLHPQKSIIFALFLGSVLNFSSCYSFIIFNPSDATHLVHLYVEKKEIAALDMSPHSYYTLSTFNNVPALDIIYQVLGSLVPTFSLNPLQFLVSWGWLISAPI